ncbi:MAG: SDR family NAD(P)-dependent oxidoreductase [Acidobacteriia bacterium]|nr:SDR family NAD(P)-dependent oxidoreductase [Terriglobia bacterium]
MVKFSLRNGVAVITGAAGGIGRALAFVMAERGCRLALADRDPEGLAAVAGRLRSYQIGISEHLLDVADPQAVAALPQAVLERHGRVTVLVNNAGMALGGLFEDIPEADFARVFEVNFWSVVRMMRAFLPALRREPAAQIVNISSLFGLVSPAGQSAYCATKFAVRAVSEAVRHELEQEKGPVRLSVVHPGGVRTNILDNAQIPQKATEEEIARERERYRKLLATPPEKVAEQIVRGVERREKRILVGAYARQGDLVQRLLPASYWTIMRVWMKAKTN